jgi:ABC-type sugar transport system, permease component
MTDSPISRAPLTWIRWARTPGGTSPLGIHKPRYGTHLFLLAMSVLWLIPLLWTLYTSLRPKADTDKYGYFSRAHTSL